MNKAERIAAIADQTGQAKADVTETLDALLDIIGAALAQGDKLQLTGFGVFAAPHRVAAARQPK